MRSANVRNDLNWQFQKFQEENQMERKFPYEIFETETWVAFARLSSFPKILDDVMPLEIYANSNRNLHKNPNQEIMKSCGNCNIKFLVLSCYKNWDKLW